jgi:polysaccharide biosynthesis protein PslG
MNDGCGAVTVGRSSLHTHDRGIARLGLALLATLLAAAGLAIGWTVGADVAGTGGSPPQAAAPIATQPVATLSAPPTPAPTLAPTPTPAPTLTPTSSAPGSTTGGGTAGGATAAATHLDPRFGMSGNLLSGTIDTARSEIDMLADDGLGVVRFDVSWRDVEPSPGSYRGLDKLDAVVATAAGRSMQTIVVVAQTPGWANSGKSAWVPPTDAADYARFVGMLAQRYAGRVAAWEVWDQPDQARFWRPGPNAAAYARLLLAAARSIRKADPSATVIGGSVAFDQAAFVRAMYGHGVAGSFDVLSIHPSTTQGAPDDVGPGSLTATLDTFHNLLRHEDDEDIPIWVADLGWPVVGPGAVNADARADYVQRAVEVVRERPWVGLLTVRSIGTDDDPGYGLSTNGRRSDAWLAYAAAVRSSGE